MRVQAKIRMEFQVKSLDDADRLLAAIKKVANPYLFHADVHKIDEVEI